MSSTAAQQAYRRRLKQAGRKEILVDLPEWLVNALDQRRNAKMKRSVLVEELLRQALDGDTQEAV